jgi:ribonuclease HI
MYSLYFDGASRSNPGPASYGGVIYDENKNEVATYKKYIGHHTNNVAEYMGCFHGIMACVQENIKNVTIYGDSKLVVEQVSGRWKVKSANLRPIYNEIIKVLNKNHFEKINFKHVKRHLNKRADQLANEALDEYFSNH